MTALWKNDYVIKNKFSRPAYKLLSVKGIVIHWTASFGGTAKNHKTYFDGSDGGGGRYASAHIFVDKNEAICIIPLDEVAYHANEKACKVSKLKATASYYKGGDANLTTIGVEMCVEKDGTIHKDTIEKTAKIVAELCKKYKLDPSKDIYRHYDITGKNCPAPFVSTPSKFTNFKKRVKEIIGGDKKNVKETANKKEEQSTAKTTVTVNKTKSPSTKTKLASNIYGTATVLCNTLNVRKDASFNAKISRTVKKGTVLTVYSQKNGLYNIGNGEWVTSNTAYIKFTKNPNYGLSPNEKKIKVLVDSLWTYKTANWNDKYKTVKKGEVFTVVKELNVSGYKMYQLKSGLYIAANTKYVKVI